MALLVPKPALALLFLGGVLLAVGLGAIASGADSLDLSITGNTIARGHVTTVPIEPIPPNTYPIDPRAHTSVPPGYTALCDHCNLRNAALQSVIMHFPLVKPATDAKGRPAFQVLHLDSPAVIDGYYYYGFRFTVPPRPHDDDFVWAFVYPFVRDNEGWYIMPPNGIQYIDSSGFNNYFQTNFIAAKASFKNLSGLEPAFQKSFYLQSLDGKLISDGSTYLIYFESDTYYPPTNVSVEFTFAPLTSRQTNNIAALEKVLNLVRNPAPAKKTRGGSKPPPGGPVPPTA
jgi:hypothetical protein